MRVLLDECLPRQLKRDLAGHEVRTVPEMGWAGRMNGDLLALAIGQFDVFVTADRNLSFQQDISRFDIRVIVLVAGSNRVADLRPLMPQVLDLLHTAPPGCVIRVGGA